MEAVFIKLTTAGVSVTALAQYLSQLPAGGEMLQAGPPARDQLVADEESVVRVGL